MSDELTRAARYWWRMKRPDGWCLEDHLMAASVNCATHAERRLAVAVARTFKVAGKR